MKEFNKVIGYDDIKIELIRIVDMMLNPNKFSELGVKTTRGLIRAFPLMVAMEFHGTQMKFFAIMTLSLLDV